jgi:hypothetical protein
MNRQIKFAKIKNIPGIINVLQKNLIANQKSLSNEILEEKGFLIHGFTSEDIKASIADKKHSIVSVSIEENEVIGYIIGCNITQLNAEFQKKLSAISNKMDDLISSKKTLYYRQIAKLPEKTNAGTGLFQFLLDTATNQGYQYIICQIAHAPLKNKPSIEFHKKFGFDCVGSNQDKEVTLGIYLKQLF